MKPNTNTEAAETVKTTNVPAVAQERLVSLDAINRLERKLNEARNIAKYWQEQYGHCNPSHEWDDLPWE